MIQKEDQVFSLNKAELHIHLNGLFDTTMIKEVLDNENTEIPFNFDVAKDLNILHSKRSLIQYLKPWEVLRLMPKKEENLLKLIDNAFDKLKTDNIRFVELRSSVIYLSSLLNKPLEETLILFITLLNQVSSKYKIKYGLILTITRGDYSMSHLTTLMNAYKNIDTPKEIVGIDLAGNEDIQVSMDLGSAFR
jgi:adenosine deaminase